MVDSSNNMYIKRADDFRKEADKKLKGSFFGNLVNGKEDRDREAKDLYQQAANCYKAANDRDSAIECLMRCIDCEPESMSKADLMTEAAKIIKAVNTDKYIKYINEAI